MFFQNSYFKNGRFFAAAVLSVLLLTSDLEAQVSGPSVSGLAGNRSVSGQTVADFLMQPESISETFPIYALFSAHATVADAERSLRKMRFFLRNIPKNRPVTVWLEHAAPLGLPQSIEELQSGFGHSAGAAMDWVRELTGDSLSVRAEALLRRLYREAEKSEARALSCFEQAQDPFSQTLRRGIEKFREEGWGLRYELEKPVFEAYLNSLRRDAMGKLAVYWLRRGEIGKALACLSAAYRFFSESLMMRDEKFGRQVADRWHKNPGDVHFIFRGLAHEGGLTNYFSSRQARFCAAITGPGLDDAAEERVSDIHRYVLQYHQLPSAQTLHGGLFLIRQLLSSKFLQTDAKQA
jgi:hypothetical protein